MDGYTGGGGGRRIIWCGGDISPGKRTLANPKAYAASRTHRTAKAPGFRRGEMSPPSLNTKVSHAVIPPSPAPDIHRSVTEGQ